MIESPPTTPSVRSGTPSSAAASVGAHATTTWPPPSPKSRGASSGSSSSAPTPLQSAASASATASPPSAASCAREKPRGVPPDERDERRFRLEIERRGRAADSAEAGLVLGAVQGQRPGGGEEDDVALAPSPGHRPHVLDEPDAADDRRRVDRPPIRLVVERHVPRDDRGAERLGGQRHPLDRLRELPGDLGLLRVAEVQAVRQRERPSADAGDVPGCLEHRQRAARARVEPAGPRGGVERDREAAERRPKPEHGRVQPGAPDRARADELVVPAEDPRARADVRRREQLEQRLPMRRRLGRRRRRRAPAAASAAPRSAVPP